MKTVKLALIFIFFGSQVHADFEDLGANARSIAMGGALTGLSDDAQTVTINPAGLGYLKRAEVGADYGRLYMGLQDNSDISLNSILFGIPIFRHITGKIKNVGKPIPPPISFLDGGNSNHENMNSIYSDTTTLKEFEMMRKREAIPELSRRGSIAIFYKSFSVSNAYQESTLGLGWGKSFGRRWNAGLNIKKLSESYQLDDYTRVDPLLGSGGKSSVSAMSFDLGFLYNLRPRVFIGGSLLDLNQPNVGLKAANSLPRTQKIGLGYKWNGLCADLDWSKRNGMTTYGTGVEKYLKHDQIGVRAGFMFGDGSLSVLSGGFGFKMGLAMLDYAIQFSMTGIQKTSGSHRVSLVFKFGQPLANEADPGSLEQAYLQTQDKLTAIEAKLKETEENRNSLEKVLVEESTLRIQERIDSARALARSQAKSKQETNKDHEVKEPSKVKVKTHRVEKGDTLQSLAELYYGNRSKWKIIYDENKENIQHGGSIRKGQLLIIPPLELEEAGKESNSGARKSKFSNSESAPDLAKPDPKSKWSKPGDASSVNQPVINKKIHTVKDGDTLQSIAQQYYGSSSEWQKIYSANKDKITRGVPNVGAELIIP